MHASAPLRSGDRTLGILNVAAPDWSSFNPQSLALLTNVGNQIGVALERAQLFDLLRERRIREQAALLKLSNQLLSRLDLNDLIGYLVEEVQHILQADACALLLTDDQLGYLDFRAVSGWQSDPVSAGWRVPADEQSGPGLAMRTQHPFLVEDIAERDPAPWLPNWLEEEGFRGHAVMPLIANGHSVGALVIDTRKPRLWNEDEVRLLRLMGNQAAIAIEKARLHEEEVKKQGLEKEMALGQQIQLSLLPKSPPIVPGWEFAVYYQAAHQVGGDFYDFFELPDEPGQLGLLVADVVGKGVPAALFMALSRTTIRTVALSGGSPATVLERANELILKDSYSDFFLTAFYAVLDTHSGHLVYANGGHNWPLWLQATTGEFQEWTAQTMLLGSLDSIQLEERELDMAPGDLLIFYTDGVTEAMNSDHQLFGEERFRAAVAARAEAGAQQILDSVVDAIKAHTGDTPQSDDVTLLVVKRHPLS
jgi:sigma-B regulation protein RsbU (phosphoserine phosphatase)